ncbi:MAG: class I SAM-dependent methyltransferase [Paracoccaceae bacterium]|nr:class I SAM-dependent methyltransferase [Paracoccaceae bacterium]
MSDLLARSSAHWSEAGRAGMEAFYRLATDDYRHLALARDWRALFEAAQARAGDRPLRLLDVACGSGKFPNALVRHGGLADACTHPVETALLDPSAFSIAEARAALPAPFRAVAEHETTLQGFAPPPEGYDLVWATHALYAIPQAELEAAMERFRSAIAPGGTGLIAHSAEAGHYIGFHRRFLAAFGPESAAPYVSAEAIAQTLRAQGAQVEVQEVVYDSAAGPDEMAVVEGYLQRCVFDERASLAEMQVTAPLADYLAGCRRPEGWRFHQCVWLMTVSA